MPRRARFIFPDGSVRYLAVVLKDSTIKGAGKGAFAPCLIPKGSYAFYRGEFKDEKHAHMEYSWEFYDYDPETGESLDEILGYVDAFKKGRGTNFTRYVNCGPRRKDNNIDCVQVFDKIRYVAMRDIKKGEEMFCDYGHAYRHDNLGMKHKY